MTKALVGWIVLGLAALAWELLGVFGVAGIWPLTDLVWHAEGNSPDVAVLIVFLAVVGFPAWLVYHFVFQRHRKV